MQIKLIHENGEEEWLLIEIQGSFEIESNLSGKLIGYLGWREDSTVCFIIGHQFLEGKIIKLERPFLVINKSWLRIEKTNDLKENNIQIKECDIIGVIKRKVIFKERPKPIVLQKL